MKRLWFALSPLALVGILVTAACSGAGTASETIGAPVAAAAGSNGAQQITVTVSSSMSFDPASITVHAGQPVQLTLRNTGLMPHDFTLDDGVAQPVKITATGGQSAIGSFTIDTPGTYSFDCSMPGHAAAGMRGTITAQ